MKKDIFKFIIALLFASFTTASHAQWFVGSNFGYQYASEKESLNLFGTGKVCSEFSFALMFGYQTNRFAMGGRIGFAQNTATFNANEPYSITKKRTFFGVQPFVRHTFVEYGKFSMFANVGIHLFIRRIQEAPPVGFLEDRIRLGINLTPVVSYNLSQKINLEVSLNFMNLGWNREQRNLGIGNKNPNTYFGFGANSGNGIDVGAVSIGFIYNFKN